MPLHCISSDLHRGNVDRYAVSLARTMTKMRALGMSLEDVVLRVTANPARAIEIDNYGFGSFTEGLSTTATIFRERETDDMSLEDAEGSVLNVSSYIEPIGTVVNGQFHTAKEPI